MTNIPTACWVDPRVEVRTSPIEGLGLFATVPIRKGELVEILGGRVITDEDLRKLAKTIGRYNSLAIDEGLNLILEGDDCRSPEPWSGGTMSAQFTMTRSASLWIDRCDSSRLGGMALR